MIALSQPVVAAIVRGMSAYMQAANKIDLPASLRSLQGKHLKMLTARRDDIVASLEDPALRARVLDWLEKKPVGISKPDASVLAAAARRDEGWEKLGASTPRKTPVKKAPADGSVVEREREKARKARDEARRSKADAASQVTAARQQVVRLEEELAGLKKSVRDLQREVEVAVNERDSLRAESQREIRKARRRAEKAEGELERVTKELRAKSKEATVRESRSKPVAKTPATARRPRTVKEPQRRARLSVPKGRFEDAPETLEAWLATPEVHLLVDGYNVSKAKGGFGDLKLETQRLRVVQELGKLARKHGIKATIVFDGSEVAPGISRRSRGPVAVEYSRADEIADDHLVAKLEGLPKHPVIVVTNDRELQRRTARLGATIATSDQLLELIR